MHIDELFSPDLLAAEIDAKRIRPNDHPTLPLRLYNYTELAQYQKAWNDVTRNCRGLIVHRETGEVVARPFPKFFNHSEDLHPDFDLSEPVTVTDKLDGSLGIIYPAGDGGYAVATRGSFTSEQAIHATQMLRTKYPDWAPPAGWTALFEIIYPANRIVVDYGKADDLVLLGGVSIESGISCSPAGISWPGPITTTFGYESFADALAAGTRKNAEGLVVHFRTSDVRVKIKQDDYVALHRIVTGWNERTIWERLASGESLDLLIEGLPDEFHKWATGIADGLSAKHTILINGACTEHLAILNRMPSGWTRKDYALEAAKRPLFRPALFQLLDGRDINDWAWKQIYPTYEAKEPAAA
ncbi:RNA ligase [Arthrobacter phage Seahorse]|uniref:RNA ligase n=1 Tax=Arthrobacter phage Seahorse TaxID=2419611 RepID=A0A3G3M5C2_9CAUD|nr:RNA ligase [Arthrobacter phage Seahorse]AYR01581.1 RNA ligase [Arthrobacter phage Seahorse]